MPSTTTRRTLIRVAIALAIAGLALCVAGIVCASGPGNVMGGSRAEADAAAHADDGAVPFFIGLGCLLSALGARIGARYVK